MSALRVKICGTTSLEDARLSAEAGADMLGFIFYEHSPRNIAPEAAAEIVRALREELEQPPLMVGVTVDEPVARVQALREQVGLDLFQLHGSEPPREVERLTPYAFKAIRPQNRGDAEAFVATYGASLPDNPDAPDFLLDAHHPWKMGGTGERASWAAAVVLARRYRLLLAGGLTVENVAEAVRDIRPWGVDVVSGVEASKGVKDPEKVRAFIQVARGVAQG